MKKFIKLLLLSIILFGAFSANAETKRALLVGISDYGNAKEDPNKWANIHGANDIPLLTPLLKERGFKVTSLVNSQATYKGIKKAIDELIKNCKKGDIVYLHFSMHGQPVEDLNGDEEDGWDEALIPVDAQMQYKKGVYEGQNHLLDDELSKYIDKLRTKLGSNGNVYVVLDACHSGTLSRGDEENIRGSHEGFTSTGKLYKPDKTKETNDYFNLSTKPGQSPALFIEACRSYELNREWKDEENIFGSLSFCIAYALQNNGIIGSDEWLENIKEKMNSRPKSISKRNRQNIVIEKSK